MKPFTQGLRLNPEADAEALAHSGLLIPYAPESAVKPEPISVPEPHLNPEVTNEPSDGVQALPAPPEADDSLERKSTGINGVTFSADVVVVVGVDGMTKPPTEAAGKAGADEPADTADEDIDRQGKASASGQGLPSESEGPVVMVTAGDQSSEGKRRLGEMHYGSTSTSDVDGIREAKRHKSVMLHSSTTDTQPPLGSAPIAALNGGHDSIDEDDTSRPPARGTVSRKSPSPVLTTKDGSPSSAAPRRSIATPSRVKIPKQQPTMSLT